MYLYSTHHTWYISTGCRRCLRAIRGVPANNNGVHSETYSKAMIERVWRWTWRRWSSGFGDTLGGPDWVNLEMHSGIVIERVWRCTWRPWLCQLAGIIERVLRYTWRPWSSEFGDAHGGHDCARLDQCFEAVDWRRAGCWDSIHLLVNSQPWECDNVTLPLSSRGVLGDAVRSCREVRRKPKPHAGVIS